MQNGALAVQANTAADMRIDSVPNTSSCKTIARKAAQRWGTTYKALVLSAKTEFGVILLGFSSLDGTSQVKIKQIKERHGLKLVASCSRMLSLLILGIIGKTTNVSEEHELSRAGSGTTSLLAMSMGSA